MKTLIRIFPLIIMMTLVGCELGGEGGTWSPEGGNESIDPVSSILQFPDVPVPNGFKLDNSVSFSYQKDKKRFGKLVYRGKMDLAELEAFLIDQLEFQQWKLDSKTLRGGVNALFFNKGTEELQIFMSGSGWSTRLEMILG